MLIIKEFKRCPECGLNTMKDGGCDHITCNKCFYEYCWLCFDERKSYSGHTCKKVPKKDYLKELELLMNNVTKVLTENLEDSKK